jgi:hypothetical protein
VAPVGCRLHADPFDGDGCTLDAEQPLEEALRGFVAAFAEVVIPDDAVCVDEVESGPEAVLESPPDRIVVVERDGVVDLPFVDSLPDPVRIVFERELWRVDSNYDQPVASIFLRPGTNVGLLAQPVDAGQRSEVHQDDAALQLVRAEWLGV